MFDFLFRQKKSFTPLNENQALSSALLLSAISELSDAVIAYDEDFQIILFNSAAERIFGISTSLIIGERISLARASDPRLKLLVQVFFPSLAPRIIPRSPEHQYPQTTDLDFDFMQLRVITHRFADEHGVPQGFIKVVRDLTRTVALLKSKSEFLTVAAHQLRTPLTAVGWAFDGLQKDTTLTEDSRELVNAGGLAAKKLLQIVDDLLNVSKAEDGKFGYVFAEGDIIVFLDKVLSEAKPVADAYSVRLYLQPSNVSVPPILFDAQKLGMAFANLLDNAIKYNTPNGSVTVSVVTHLHEPYIEIRVADTGVGIPREAMEKLFTKFFRAENVTKFATEGSGLGLYLVKNIIERHGGKIWIESELGRGTIVHFTLPTDPSLVPQKEFVEGEGWE